MVRNLSGVGRLAHESSRLLRSGSLPLESRTGTHSPQETGRKTISSLAPWQQHHALRKFGDTEGFPVRELVEVQDRVIGHNDAKPVDHEWHVVHVVHHVAHPRDVREAPDFHGLPFAILRDGSGGVVVVASNQVALVKLGQLGRHLAADLGVGSWVKKSNQVIHDHPSFGRDLQLGIVEDHLHESLDRQLSAELPDQAGRVIPQGVVDFIEALAHEFKELLGSVHVVLEKRPTSKLQPHVLADLVCVDKVAVDDACPGPEFVSRNKGLLCPDRALDRAVHVHNPKNRVASHETFNFLDRPWSPRSAGCDLGPQVSHVKFSRPMCSVTLDRGFALLRAIGWESFAADSAATHRTLDTFSVSAAHGSIVNQFCREGIA
jgi:hypothetical protein